LNIHSGVLGLLVVLLILFLPRGILQTGLWSALGRLGLRMIEVIRRRRPQS